ncbi:DUF6766 family protein [Caulobacter sp. 73W]|uniref:DUF6766 family protein n=1 Tax=Caulobacter sp. 73W TaxID=3161137 RepID=A0AB39KWS0_9CAUL
MSNVSPAASFKRRIADNGLTLALIALFAISLLGHWVFGWRAAVEELQRHGQPMIGLLAYAGDPEFLSTVFENWESEFLQMSVYVVLTAMLIQRGSAESRAPDDPPRDTLPSDDVQAPRLARAAGVAGWLYSHSLGLVLAALFVASFILHWLFSARAAAQEALLHGQPVTGAVAYLGDAQLWFESFQNWQSEFLSTAALVVFSIFLRHKNSPESKPVAAPDHQTGA